MHDNKAGFDYFIDLVVKKWLLTHYNPDEAYVLVKTRQFYCQPGFRNTLAAKYLKTCCINNELWARCEVHIKNYIVAHNALTKCVVENRDSSAIEKYRTKMTHSDDALFELTGKSIASFLYKNGYVENK